MIDLESIRNEIKRLEHLINVDIPNNVPTVPTKSFSGYSTLVALFAESNKKQLQEAESKLGELRSQLTEALESNQAEQTLSDNTNTIPTVNNQSPNSLLIIGGLLVAALALS